MSCAGCPYYDYADGWCSRLGTYVDDPLNPPCRGLDESETRVYDVGVLPGRVELGERGPREAVVTLRAADLARSLAPTLVEALRASVRRAINTTLPILERGRELRKEGLCVVAGIAALAAGLLVGSDGLILVGGVVAALGVGLFAASLLTERIALWESE